MKKQLQNLAVCALLAIPTLGFAGGDAPLEAAEEYVYKVRQVSIPEAEQLFMEPGVRIFDVNTLELWAEGYIPGAVFFNVGNWKKLLPKDKNTLIVFYCANRLCSSSQIAAYETMKLGYTNVWQMESMAGSFRGGKSSFLKEAAINQASFCAVRDFSFGSVLRVNCIN